MSIQTQPLNTLDSTNKQNTTSNQTHSLNYSISSNTVNHTLPSNLSNQPTYYQHTHPSNQLHITSSNPGQPTNYQPPFHPLNQLHIASLNTRGLNDETKFKCLLNYIQLKKYSIFGISETKIKESSKKYFSNNNSIIHWSSTNSSQAGVALIINPTLFKHHLKTESYNGYIISSFFNFKPSTTLCITQIYLPHDPNTKKQVINYLKDFILLNSSKNIPHIIMGDFNSVPDPLIDKLHNNSPTQKNHIYNYLTFYTDSFRHLHPHSIKFTYTGPTQQSRIDQIWISNIIINYLVQANITKTNLEFQSDHKITSVTLNSFFKTGTHTLFPTSYIKYNHHRLTPDDWLKIQKTLDQKIQPLLNDTNDPQRLWDSFQNLIDSQVLPKIPQIKIKTKNHSLFNKNGTLLHKQLLLINSTIYNIKKQKDKLYPSPSTLTKKLDKLNLSYQIRQESI